jgi:hypothetical protein
MIVIKTITKRHISEITSRNLSIQFSLDGFSFCISNQEHVTYALKKFSFAETVSVDRCLEEIVSVFKSEEELQSDFESITVIHQNYLNTVVPNELFNETELSAYLQFSIKTLATDTFAFDSIPAIGAKNVYIPYVNVNNFLFQNFGEFEFKHHTTVLIEKLLSKNKGLNFYVHVSKNHLDVIVLEEKKLVLCNSFEYTSKEDFIYYVLFVAEQLKMDPNVFSLVLIGDHIEKDSELYTILYTYVRNVTFLENNHDLLINSTDFSNHSNFMLLG